MTEHHGRCTYCSCPIPATEWQRLAIADRDAEIKEWRQSYQRLSEERMHDLQERDADRTQLRKTLSERDADNKCLRKLLRERKAVIEGQDAEIQRLRKLLTDVRTLSDDDPYICNYIDAHTKGGDAE